MNRGLLSHMRTSYNIERKAEDLEAATGLPRGLETEATDGYQYPNRTSQTPCSMTCPSEIRLLRMARLAALRLQQLATSLTSPRNPTSAPAVSRRIHSVNSSPTGRLVQMSVISQIWLVSTASTFLQPPSKLRMFRDLSSHSPSRTATTISSTHLRGTIWTKPYTTPPTPPVNRVKKAITPAIPTLRSHPSTTSFSGVAQHPRVSHQATTAGAA